MKSRIGVNSGKCFFQIDQFQGKPSPRNALAGASKKRRRLASRAIWPPNVLDSARLLSTVRTRRLGCHAAGDGGGTDGSSSASPPPGSLGAAAATGGASVAAMWAACLGSQKLSGGSGWGSSTETV